MAQHGTAAESSIDRKLINKLTEEQMARFREHTPTSAEYFDRARKVMPGGVPSSFQLNDPWPVYIDRGKGALVSAQNLVERFGLPQWRFSNSGTESTLSVIHHARAATERDLVIKIEGSYDG